MNLDQRILSLLKRRTRNSIALNTHEIADSLDTSEYDAIFAIQRLINSGVIRVAGSDDVGRVYAYVGRKTRCNPTPGKRASKKARDWYQNESLITEPRKISIPDSMEFVEIGEILAIEYESNKFEGRKVAYRHDVTHHRKMHISTDGSVIIIEPGFKVTKRGIEG